MKSLLRRGGGGHYIKIWITLAYLVCYQLQPISCSAYISNQAMNSFFPSFLEWGETECTWYVGHYLAYCTSRGWYMMVSVEHSVEWLAGETEVLGENQPKYRVVYHKSHMTWSGLESGPLRWEAGVKSPELRHGQNAINKFLWNVRQSLNHT
jgi:hypothetical protein